MDGGLCRADGGIKSDEVIAWLLISSVVENLVQGYLFRYQVLLICRDSKQKHIWELRKASLCCTTLEGKVECCT